MNLVMFYKVIFGFIILIKIVFVDKILSTYFVSNINMNFNRNIVICTVGLFLGIFSSLSIAQAQFVDVDATHEHFEAINYVQRQGIVSGYSNGSFRPDQTINRAEFTKIIMESLYDDEIEGKNCFSDVAEEWFARYVCSAQQKNIIGGYPDGSFQPAQRISFVEAAKIIVSAYEGNQIETEAWYEVYVQNMADNNVIPVQIITLEQRITRGQLTEMVYRVRERVDVKASKRYEDFVNIERKVGVVNDTNVHNENEQVEQSDSDEQSLQLEDESAATALYRGATNAGVYASQPVKAFQQVKWKFDAVSPLYTAPNVFGNALFFGTENGLMVAVNKNNGETLWKTTTLHRNFILATPIITDVFVMWGGYDAYFYNISTSAGQKVWKTLVGSSVYGSPTMIEDKVIFGAEDGFVRAFDSGTGAEKWRLATRGEVFSSPAIYKRVAIVGSLDKHVYAVSVDKGQLAWKFATNNEIASSPAVGNDKVYIGNKSGTMYALNANTGSLVWTFDTEGEIITAPAVTSKFVIFGSKDGFIYALDAESGQLQWKFKTQGEVLSSPSIAGNVVYVGSSDKHLYALDSNTGNELWKFETEGKISASPLIVDGVVYVASQDGYLYALE